MKNLKFFTPVILSLFGLFLAAKWNTPIEVSSIQAVSPQPAQEESLLANPSCNTPTWPTTSNITNTSATFTWDPVWGADSYTVQIHIPNGSWSYVPGGPFYDPWVTVYNLAPGTTYEWRVRANCWGGQYSYWTAPVSFTTYGNASCDAPDWLNTSNITQTTATWNWSSVSNAISYTVQWRYPNGTWYNLGGPWTNNWIAVGGLDPGTTYQWRVRSNCSNWDYSPWSYIETFTTLNNNNSCNTPTWPSTSNITQTSATFSWDEVWGADSYTVQTRLPNGAWYTVPGSPTSNTWITVNGLTPNTTYEWRVRANCWGGQYSDWTWPISFTTSGSSSCYAPDWLYTTNITSTSAKLDWSSVNGAQSYSVQWRYPGGSWYDLPGTFTDSWTTITGLQPNTTYEWRVRSNCNYWNYSTWSWPASFTTLGASCNAPTWLYTSNITQTSATLSWDEVWGAQGYSVQIRSTNGQWYTVPGSPCLNNYITVWGLTPCTNYEWRVKTICSNWQYSNWSPLSYFTTQCDYCHAPSWLYTSNITQSSATLDWDPVNGAYSYSVQWRYPGGAWYDLPGTFTASWTTITGLQPGTAYEWRVRANCSDWNYSPWSYPAYFTTLGYSCATPSWTYTTNITETSATLSWSEVWGAESYTVQIRQPNGNWYDAPGSPTNYTSLTLYNLYTCTSYEWRVRSNCSGWQYSYWSPTVYFTTLCNSCYASSWLYTTNITQTTAKFDWAPVSGAQSYTVQWRNNGGDWYDLGTFTDSWTTISGLQPCTTYQWRVRSNCYNGSYSSWSGIATFTTLCTSSCSTPTWPTTTNITQTSATFSWDPVPGAVSYSVQTRVPNGVWYDAPGSPFSANSVTVNGFNPNTTYEWRVRANCGGGQYSDWTFPQSFTTSGSNCSYPQYLWSTDITATSAIVHWSVVSGAESYNVQWRNPGGSWNDVPGGPWFSNFAPLIGLQPATEYEYHVQVNCSNGSQSAWSFVASFITLSMACDTPTGLFTTAVNQTGATFNWSAVAGAVDYSVEIRLPNGTWSYIPGNPFADTTATATGLNPGTTYEWRVRTNCAFGVYSLWSQPLTFTTSNAGVPNDNCSGATLLTVNNTCVNTPATNVNSTASSPPPEGCWSNGSKDVWFKFVMPDGDPSVTIRTTAGSLTDGIMEVYIGSTCQSMTYLTCEDDNSDGNGSTMPVININGNANETIWVRVWGYNGSTGTFSICVLDYFSPDFVTYDDLNAKTLSEDVTPQLQNSISSSDQHLLTSPHVTPNPVSEILYVTKVQTETSIVTGLVLTNLSGQIMMKKDYASHNLILFHEELDMSGFIQGMYVLQIITTEGVLSEKVMVVHN